jgi:adenosine deaminase
MDGNKSISVSKDVESLIRRIPKTDLHVHLDGSLRLPTLLEIAKTEQIELPSYTVEGLNELVFKDSYADLVEYLKTFGYSTAVMQRAEYLERIAYELAVDNQNEGVRYMEVRFAPQLHMHKDLDMKTILESVNNGLDRAKKEFNQRKEIISGQEPPFEYGIIVCALRSFGPYSEYYANLISVHAYSDLKSIFRHASIELARGAVRIRDELGLPVVAFDLAGAEAGNPARGHRYAFQYAHENFMAKTVHAGEAYGPPSIFQAISELHADRIGHGFYLFDETKVDKSSHDDSRKYIEALTQFIADRRVTIEVCLTSNLQTIPALGSLANHSFPEMLAHELSLTICTDNRTVSKTSVTKEILLAIEHFDISPRQLKNVIVYGFKRSFFPESYTRKRNYVRRCIDYYEELVAGTVLQ